MLRLVAVWEGWRRPLRTLEVFNARQELVAVLPVELLVQLIRHHLQAGVLSAAVREAVEQTRALDADLPPARPAKPLKAVNGRKLRGR